MRDDDDDKTNHPEEAEPLTVVPAVSRDEDDDLEGVEEEESWEESDLSSYDDNEDGPFPEDFPTSFVFGGNRQGRSDVTPMQVDHLFLSTMPSKLLVFCARFFESNCCYIPADEGYRLMYPGGLKNPKNLRGDVMVSFLVDDEWYGWVETYNEETRRIKWIRIGQALDQDAVQLVFEVIRRGLIFQNWYWWFVTDWLHVLKPVMNRPCDDGVHIHYV